MPLFELSDTPDRQITNKFAECLDVWTNTCFPERSIQVGTASAWEVLLGASCLKLVPLPVVSVVCRRSRCVRSSTPAAREAPRAPQPPGLTRDTWVALELSQSRWVWDPASWRCRWHSLTPPARRVPTRLRRILRPQRRPPRRASAAHAPIADRQPANPLPAKRSRPMPLMQRTRRPRRGVVVNPPGCKNLPFTGTDLMFPRRRHRRLRSRRSPSRSWDMLVTKNFRRGNSRRWTRCRRPGGRMGRRGISSALSARVAHLPRRRQLQSPWR